MSSFTPCFFAAAFLGAAFSTASLAQTTAPTTEARPDVETLRQINAGRNPPAYPVPYVPASVAEITDVLNRVYGYLDAVTPAKLVDRTTQAEITDLTQPLTHATVARGDFQLTSYEWGVTYSGMWLAAEVTGEAKYREYVAERFKFIAEKAPLFAAAVANMPETPVGARLPEAWRTPFRQVNIPRSLDDSGAMAAAMIKAARGGVHVEALRPFIDRYLKWISQEQFRFPDGTLARNRPLENSLWLDDLYMSVPALAQMGALTGDGKYFDDAVKQIVQFSERMFVGEKGLYMHGWIGGMEPHPVFHWGRANGWAILAMTELLNVLPTDHPGREKVLALYRAHVRGIAATQGGAGLWHQLLDRTDSYLETSASAIFVYCIARGINQGWLDARAHIPMVSLGWNAVAKQVNAKGQVENVCVGTGMGFDPAFYYYRPVNVFAAHGYGPVLMAGAEMITLRKGKAATALVSDGAVQMEPAKSRH
jgi:unsaturated rhamnogalacturonyl hydrolase